ncbi:hypothetical protein C2E23DRAFT_732632 [Lenzites betulinus]|nr:hypothetical protein C2E23DRAFT_732632 [Lenzites betulinus]
MDLYRGSNGQYHFGSIDIPAGSLDDFAEAFRSNMHRSHRLGVPFFQVELRGTKGMYSFPFADLEAREEALNNMLDHLNMASERNHLERWYVDVGMEVVRPYHVVQWLSGAHEQLLSHALPGLSPIDISHLHHGSLFSEDISGHLFDLAGLRCHPGARGRSNKVAHVNIYTTDKSVTYQLHRGAFTAHPVSSLYPGTLPKLLSDINTIAKMFTQCAGASGQTQDATARFEIRVGMEKALTTLTTFPDEILRASAICIPNSIWWYVITIYIYNIYIVHYTNQRFYRDFKFCRIAAIHYVLKDIAEDPPRSRVLYPSLALGAIMIYALNAVISRPGDWQTDRALADACAMRVPLGEDIQDPLLLDQDHDPTDSEPVAHQQGLYFVCDILRDEHEGWWRLPIKCLFL